MNAEDDMERYFIQSQRKPRASQKNIYTIKYFTIMLTQIIVAGTYAVKSEIQNYAPSFHDYILFMAAVIIAFIISSFSQFIGHRLLYTLSYTIFSVFFILINLYGLFSSAMVLFYISRIYLMQQTVIQIYGTWPLQFGRIFAEMIIYYYITRLIIEIIKLKKYDEDLICLILIVMMVVNLIWLLCGLLMPRFKSINDFKPPETDSVLKDFFRSLCNIKIIILTLLYFVTIFSVYISIIFLSNNFKQLKIDQSERLMYTAGTPILSLILLWVLININLKPQLIFFISLLILLSLLLIQSIQIQFSLIVLVTLYFTHIVVFFASRIFVLQIYGQILLNIAIRNLDLITSYQLIAFESSFLLYIYLYEEQSSFIIEHYLTISLSFFVIIITLSFIFYQVLGFKQYIKKNINALQFEKDRLQLEIV